MGDFLGALKDAVIGGRSFSYTSEAYERYKSLLLKVGRKKLSFRIGDLMQTPEFKGFLKQNGGELSSPITTTDLFSSNSGEKEQALVERKASPEKEVNISLGEKEPSKHLGEMQFGTEDELKNLFPEIRNLL